MRVVAFARDGVACFGAQVDGGVIELGAASELNQWLSQGGGEGVPEGDLVDVREDDLLPPITDPGKILCIGLNYRRHAAESGLEAPKSPVMFSKFRNALARPGAAVALPPSAREYDYEGELVAVIGRRCSHVSERDALKFVAGYTIGNDLSARDLQFRTSQWLLGKTLDGFLPLGPALVTSDEVPDPQDLRLRTRLNGEVRQDSSTADMIFSVAELVSYASTYFTLEPGDLIVTGTPEGVIMGMPDKNWLKPGDEVTVEIDGLGTLRTPLI